MKTTITIQDVRIDAKTTVELYKLRMDVVSRIEAIQKKVLEQMPIQLKINGLTHEEIRTHICNVDDLLLKNLYRQLEILDKKCREVSDSVSLFYDFIDTLSDKPGVELLMHIVLDNCSFNEVAAKMGISKSTAMRRCRELEHQFIDMQLERDDNADNREG